MAQSGQRVRESSVGNSSTEFGENRGDSLRNSGLGCFLCVFEGAHGKVSGPCKMTPVLKDDTVAGWLGGVVGEREMKLNAKVQEVLLKAHAEYKLFEESDVPSKGTVNKRTTLFWRSICDEIETRN